MNIAVLKWKDKRDILMISIDHRGDATASRKLNRANMPVNKPDCILDYNIYMRGVDRPVIQCDYVNSTNADVAPMFLFLTVEVP